jgi:hypothetical protein
MTVKLSTNLRNAMIGSYESYLGISPTLQIFTGTEPASITLADTGTKLLDITLPTDWLTAPSNGSVALQGTWTGTALAPGTCGYYRLKSSGGAVHEQGSVYQTGGVGDLELDNVVLTINQTVQVLTWTRTQGGQ